MKSIRLYLMVALLATITLGVFLAALHGYRSSLGQTLELLDTQLADTAAIIQSMQQSNQTIATASSDQLVFQIWDQSGLLVQRSSNAPEFPIAPFAAGYSETNFKEFRWRVLARFDTTVSHWTLVAERLDTRFQVADGIVLKSVLPVVFVLPVIAVIVWLVVGSGLALVRNLAGELANKRADDLSRLKIKNPPNELVPVVDAVNGLLIRLSAAVQRERSFAADAAHELRTPLSALKIHVYNLKPEMKGQSEEFVNLENDLDRLEHLIEQILQLYRMSPENFQAQMSDVDLYSVAQNVIADLYEEVEKKNQTIEMNGSSQLVTGEAKALGILLGNLVGNAIRYSPGGEKITVSIGSDGDEVFCRVSDTGPGIPDSDLERVLDRFYRAGGDRHASSEEGCGLGLSIAKNIADLHHARLVLTNNKPDRGLTASVIFPRDKRSKKLIQESRT